ncbi:MAG TPA: type II toxin-antitoxin system prevent-host-death family antitoxin [Devosia sp.]|nr:type II toxin-antitoxin system prevent-host-death family antitoxin [Devosia sp.]
MKHVSLADAKARLSELVTQAEDGETIEITRRGKVVARLVPANVTRPKLDIERLRRHQQSLTSPVQNTDTELAEWKDENKY